MTKKPDHVCGVVMPISALDGCSEAHWNEVLDIVSEAIKEAGFSPNLVSNSDDVGVIQKRIIQNLYDNPIVVCDVSGKNANVMFELGMRLAFDKPTIIVKDDKTTYSFDTAPIEHLEYPRDLRFSKIIEFKQRLSEKILRTFENSKNDPDYSSFLKSFGEFTVAKIKETEVSAQDFILSEITGMKKTLEEMVARNRRLDVDNASKIVVLDFHDADPESIRDRMSILSGYHKVKSVRGERFLSGAKLFVEMIPGEKATAKELMDYAQIFSAV
ncbi:hypothetical protein [Azospirillum aestuarii]|uniref:hypothetical protein n=1 Tax=Azospirillum aestuarii TaxID=2802052 RepID=UPI004054FFB7